MLQCRCPCGCSAFADSDDKARFINRPYYPVICPWCFWGIHFDLKTGKRMKRPKTKKEMDNEEWRKIRYFYIQDDYSRIVTETWNEGEKPGRLGAKHADVKVTKGKDGRHAIIIRDDRLLATLTLWNAKGLRMIVTDIVPGKKPRTKAYHVRHTWPKRKR